MYLPPTWHCAQATCVCAPVSGNLPVEWLNDAPDHRVVVWHTEQSCGKEAATWFGLVVRW